MKTNLLALLFLGFSSSFTYAATISTSCSDGSMSFDIQVSEGEVCSGTEDVRINGVNTSDSFAVNMSEVRDISVNSGDMVMSKLVLECSSAQGGSSTISASQATANGCVGGERARPEITLPERPEFNRPEFKRPEITLPERPEITLPEITLPERTEFKRPERPEFTLPEFTRPERPKIDRPNVPGGNSDNCSNSGENSSNCNSSSSSSSKQPAVAESRSSSSRASSSRSSYGGFNYNNYRNTINQNRNNGNADTCSRSGNGSSNCNSSSRN